MQTAPWPSGKAEACKAFIPRFESGWRLQTLKKQPVFIDRLFLYADCRIGNVKMGRRFVLFHSVIPDITPAA